MVDDEDTPWPPHACPAWCRRTHRAEDHPEDRIHDAEPVHAPGEMRLSMLPEHSAEPAELHVQLRQSAGEPGPWVEVRLEGPWTCAITVSVATAARLAEALAEAVAIADSGS